jgi:NAD(P)-dependent dehydrogenase (short-subunit alcohol dehydrogenase family)
MHGKTIVATGATSGVGEEAVLALAKMGARIVFVARDGARAEATLARLERAAPKLGHRVHLADLSNMAETLWVGRLIAKNERRVDVLINNAGAMFSDRRVTPEGLEMTFALNHMAYFLMTAALERSLAAAAPARIVSTSSMAHQGMRLDFSDLQSARSYNGWRAYGCSKLANILFTREAARRLKGAGVTVNCFHPGFVASRFGSTSGGWTTKLMPLAQMFAITPKEGADTAVYLASSPAVATTTGGYFVKRQETAPSAAAQDDGAARRLWEASARLAGLDRESGARRPA